MADVTNEHLLAPSEGSAQPVSNGVAKHADRIPVLDGIRGLAALLILFFHFLPTGSADPVVSRLIDLNGINWIGVDLFFVLSGFLITGILLKAKEKPRYFRNFYARRALRIFPLYYGTLTFVFVGFPLLVWAFGIEPTLKSRLGEFYSEYKYVESKQLSLWLYLSNVPGFVDPDKWLYFMGHFWSLTVEEHFYLIWPAVVLFLNRRRLVAACFVCIAISLVGRILCVQANQLFWCYTFTPLRMDGLAVGALLAIVARGDQGIARAKRPALWAGATATAALAVGFWFAGTLQFYSRFAMSLGFTLTAIVCGSFLVLTTAAPAGSVLGFLMGGKFLRFFGKYSYGLYVLNRFLMLPCKKLFPVALLSKWLGSPLLGVLANLALSILLTVGLALLSWNLFEKHFLKWKVYFEDGAPRPKETGIPS